MASTTFPTMAIRWYRAHGRRFPWRETRSPWRILLAAALLVRTPSERVALIYPTLVRKFPRSVDLARADPEELRMMIAPLGLGNRADRFIELGRALSNPVIPVPETEAELVSLPGVGPYVASAVRCFAYEQPTSVIDAVSGRVLRRVLGLTHVEDAVLRAQVDQLLPPGDPAAFGYSLLDIGALFCRPVQPKCDKCPLRSSCVESSYLPRLETPTG